MIVSGMPIWEVKKELTHDFFSSIQRKTDGTASRLRSEFLRKHHTHYMKEIEIESPHRNQWHLLFSISRNLVECIYYIIAPSRKGLMSYSICKKKGEIYLIKYGAHFFSRYQERLHIPLKQPADIIHHFFKNNPHPLSGETEVLDDSTRFMTYVYKGGVGLGWKEEKQKIISLKTFVSEVTLGYNLKMVANFVKEHSNTDKPIPQYNNLKEFKREGKF